MKHLSKFLFLIIFFGVICCNGKKENNEDKLKKEKIDDSIENCNYEKKEIIEQYKRGNYFMFSDYKDYLHAVQYLKDTFDICLFPESKRSLCVKELSNFIIEQKFGNNFLKKVENDLKQKYKNIESTKSIDGYYYYAETFPEIEGGYDSLYSYVYEQIPCNLCKDIDTFYGMRMIVDVFIDKNGKIDKVKIFQKLCPEMDNLVVVTLKKLPLKISPATNNKKTVPFNMQFFFNWQKFHYTK